MALPPRALTRELFSLAWPAVLQGLVTTVVLFTDRLILGQYSTDALASLGVSGPIVWSVFSLFTAFGAGIVAVIGRAIGAGDHARARATLRAVLWFSLILGVILTITGIASSAPFAALLIGDVEASPEVYSMSLDYLWIVLASSPLSLLGMTASTALQASGDTRSPMVAGALGGGLNLLLTWLLVYGHWGLPEMGVRGAAIGTVAAIVIVAVVTLWVLWRGGGPLGARGKETDTMRPADALRPVLKISGPTFIEKIIYHGGYLVFVALIAHLSGVALAANQALMGIEAISFIAAEGLGIAAGVMVAQKIGAGRLDEATQTVKIAVAMGAGLLSIVGVFFLIWADLCVALFTSDPEVIALGAACLRVAAIAQPLMGIADVLAGSLRGAGDTRTPMVVTVVGTVFVRLVMCWILAYVFDLGLVGVWIGSTLDWVARATWLAVVFFRGGWSRAPDVSTAK